MKYEFIIVKKKAIIEYHAPNYAEAAIKVFNNLKLNDRVILNPLTILNQYLDDFCLYIGLYKNRLFYPLY